MYEFVYLLLACYISFIVYSGFNLGNDEFGMDLFEYILINILAYMLGHLVVTVPVSMVFF